MWKKAMTYLGLGDDEDYADYELEPEPEPRRAPADRRPPAREPARPAAAPVADRRPPVRDPRDEPSDVVVRGGGTVRPMAPDARPAEPRAVDPRIADPRPASGVGAVTPRSGGGAGVQSRGAVVRPLPVPVTAKPHVVHPVSFNGAQEVADIFKGNVPVIMNLQEVDRDLSRRLIDFASGLCYGVGGSMQKVANSVYLLTPADVEVSAEEKRRLGLVD
jgi:cell division inhibitor SepF